MADDNTIKLDPNVPDPTITINPDTAANYDPAQDQRPAFQKVNLNPTGPTIEPAPKPTLAQRAISAVKENIPQFSTRTVNNPKYGKESFTSSADALTAEEQQQHPVLTGALESIDDLTSPATIGTIAATAGIGEAPVIVSKVEFPPSPAGT